MNNTFIHASPPVDLLHHLQRDEIILGCDIANLSFSAYIHNTDNIRPGNGQTTDRIDFFSDIANSGLVVLHTHPEVYASLWRLKTAISWIIAFASFSLNLQNSRSTALRWISLGRTSKRRNTRPKESSEESYRYYLPTEGSCQASKQAILRVHTVLYLECHSSALTGKSIAPLWTLWTPRAPVSAPASDHLLAILAPQAETKPAKSPNEAASGQSKCLLCISSIPEPTIHAHQEGFLTGTKGNKSLSLVRNGATGNI